MIKRLLAISASIAATINRASAAVANNKIYANLPRVNKIVEVKNQSITTVLDNSPIIKYNSILNVKIKV